MGALLLTALAFFVSPIGTPARMSGLAASLVTGGHWAWTTARAGTARLVLKVDGTVRYGERDGITTWKGSLHNASWCRRDLAVITVSLPYGVEILPIFRHRQAPGEFRRLRVHLKHRRGRVPPSPA